MDAALRSLVRQRAGGRCEYCRLRQEFLPLALQIEHIIAKQHGGSDDPSNLAMGCDRCNAYKGTNLSGIDPDTGQLAPLFHPRTQPWHDHFACDGALIVGLTPIGRATVRVLNMNAPRRVRLRCALLERGEWNP